MDHLIRKEGSNPNSCDHCRKNTKKHKIHDRDKCECFHGDPRVLEIVNKELKIARGAVGAGGQAAMLGVAGGRLAYTKYGKAPKVGTTKTTAKIGGKTTTGLMAAGAAFAVADGIMSIVDAATSKIPQDRCSKCDHSLQSPGCIQYCKACFSECIDKNWRNGSADGKCCYNICDGCFGQLPGN